MTTVPMPLKYLTVGSAAMLTTILCFLLMYALITTEVQRTPVEEVHVAANAPLHPIEKLSEPVARRRASRMLPAQPPPSPEGIPIAPVDITISVDVSRPTFTSFAEIVDYEGIEFEPFPPIQDLVPIYVVEPAYPFAAVMKQIEGYVVVLFGVRENGSVSNPVVIASEPDTLFDDAALSAISKFKFRPRNIGGDTISAQDLRLRFSFKLVAGDTVTHAEPVTEDDAP